jgi:asparagine synthase (glutamine-hydrolysing)
MHEHRPFIHICRSLRNGFIVAGTSEWSIGHRLQRSAGKPDGIYAGWSWNGRELNVTNDRYGFQPLYYFSRDEEIAVSPSIPALLDLGVSREIDEDAVSAFLRTGFYIGEDTPFRNIRLVPPVKKFRWDGWKLDMETSFPSNKVVSITRERAIEGYIDLFRQAVKRRLRPGEPFVMPVSGGRDSRHILFELCHLKCPPRLCVTVEGHPATAKEDIVVGKLMSDRLGIIHHEVLQPPLVPDVEIRKNRMTNLCSIEHGWYLELSAFLSGKTRVIYDGIAGDILTSGVYVDVRLLNLIRSGRLHEAAEEIASRTVKEYSFRSLFPEEIYQRYSFDRAVERISNDLLRHAGEPNPISSFYLWNRTRRSIALCPYNLTGIHAEVPEIMSPFLDHDLYDYLASLPGDMMADGTLHTDTINTEFPEYASLRYAERSGAMIPDRRSVTRLLRYTVEYLFRKPGGYVRQKYVLPRLLRGMLSPRYAAMSQWLVPTLVYWTQLHRTAAGVNDKLLCENEEPVAYESAG